MTLAIMQPYFFPYIGYFQLMNCADEFVVYDNIKFTKQGWINRNRILVNGRDAYFTLPLRKDSDHLDVRERRLAESWGIEKKKLLNRISGCYQKAPQFDVVFQLVEECVLFDDTNLFDFVAHSLGRVKEYLGIATSFVVSSSISIDHDLKAEKKVLALCKARGADVYVNPIGGVELYSKQDFKAEGIDLRFLKSGDISYKQFENDFIPWLSIIDVMMFNTKDVIAGYLSSSYTLI